MDDIEEYERVSALEEQRYAYGHHIDTGQRDARLQRLEDLELRRDMLVRQLRKKQPYKTHFKMNEELDRVIDEIEMIQGVRDESR